MISIGHAVLVVHYKCSRSVYDGSHIYVARNAHETTSFLQYLKTIVLIDQSNNQPVFLQGNYYNQQTIFGHTESRFDVLPYAR